MQEFWSRLKMKISVERKERLAEFVRKRKRENDDSMLFLKIFI